MVGFELSGKQDTRKVIAMLTETLPTVAEIEAAIKVGNLVGAGIFRSVYRIRDTKWVVKVECYGEGVNQKEYETRERLAPSMTRENLRFPEMHMIGEYLIAEYVQGSSGDRECKGSHTYKNALCHYSKGCARKDYGTCPDNGNCWAEITKEVSRVVADIHQNNVIITDDKIVYVIDLGEH